MSGFIAKLTETARLMVGVPSYETYLRHMAEHHPEDTPMNHTAFFRNRQDARYRGGGGRCC